MSLQLSTPRYILRPAATLKWCSFLYCDLQPLSALMRLATARAGPPLSVRGRPPVHLFCELVRKGGNGAQSVILHPDCAIRLAELSHSAGPGVGGSEKGLQRSVGHPCAAAASQRGAYPSRARARLLWRRRWAREGLGEPSRTPRMRFPRRSEARRSLLCVPAIPSALNLQALAELVCADAWRGRRTCVRPPGTQSVAARPPRSRSTRCASAHILRRLKRFFRRLSDPTRSSEVQETPAEAEPRAPCRMATLMTTKRMMTMTSRRGISLRLRQCTLDKCVAFANYRLRAFLGRRETIQLSVSSIIATLRGSRVATALLGRPSSASGLFAVAADGSSRLVRSRRTTALGAPPRSAAKPTATTTTISSPATTAGCPRATRVPETPAGWR